MSDPWNGPFSGRLPWKVDPANVREALAFPVFILPGEAFIRGVLSPAQYRRGTVLVDAFVGYGELFWEQDLPAQIDHTPLEESLETRRYPCRFSREDLLCKAEAVLQDRMTRGFLGRFRGVSCYLRPEMARGTWRYFFREPEGFRDCFSGELKAGLDFVQQMCSPEDFLTLRKE